MTHTAHAMPASAGSTQDPASLQPVDRLGAYPPATAPVAGAELYAAFTDLRVDRGLRHRDAAAALGVSECEAIASAIGAADRLRATRLDGPWPALFEQMPRVGEVMALTRNEAAVHEKVGHFASMSHQGTMASTMGLALGNDAGTALDLRIFYARWAHGFAVTEDTAAGTQRSLQIFDRHGTAVHKVFLRDASDLAAWLDIVDGHAMTGEQPIAPIEPRPQAVAERPDAEVAVEDFRWAWGAMKDAHEFFSILRQFELTRTQALRLAEPGFVTRVRSGAIRTMLQSAAADRLPIMCFVGNPGMIQIHTGPVERIAVMGPWLNVLDAGFNLHLREDHIAQAWIVRKPTSDGVVTSLEAFDPGGETIAMFFGERKPGRPELAGWRTLMESLADGQAYAAEAV